jgi:hypothetical protein
VSALPIDPTDEQLGKVIDDAAGHPDGVAGYETAHALFQAGVDAERARAAAEATVEWDAKQRARFPNDCPKCGAKTGAPCYSTPGYGSHAERREVQS